MNRFWQNLFYFYLKVGGEVVVVAKAKRSLPLRSKLKSIIHLVNSI